MNKKQIGIDYLKEVLRSNGNIVWVSKKRGASRVRCRLDEVITEKFISVISGPDDGDAETIGTVIAFLSEDSSCSVSQIVNQRCSVKHAELTIVLEMEGGAIHRVTSSDRVRVIVLERASEQAANPSGLKVVNGDPVSSHDYLLAEQVEPGWQGVSKEYVADIVQQLGGKSPMHRFVERVLHLYEGGKENAFEAYMREPRFANSVTDISDDVLFVTRCAEIDFSLGESSEAIFQDVYDEIKKDNGVTV